MSQLLSDGVDIAGNPFVIYGAIAAALAGYLVLVSQRLQKALGPLGRWLTERQLRRLRRVEQITDARIKYLGDQLEYLAAEVKQLRIENNDRRMLARVHERWDASVASQVRQLGGTVEDPPPLWPDPALWR